MFSVSLCNETSIIYILISISLKYEQPFLWHSSETIPYECNTVFGKSLIVFCAKPKEVNPIKLRFSMTNKCYDSTQIYK